MEEGRLYFLAAARKAVVWASCMQRRWKEGTDGVEAIFGGIERCEVGNGVRFNKRDYVNCCCSYVG